MMVVVSRGPVYGYTVRFDKRQYRKIQRLYRELRSLIEEQDLEAPHSEEWEELGRGIDHVSARLWTIECNASKKLKKIDKRAWVYPAMQRIDYAILEGRR